VLEHRAIAWDAGIFSDPSLHVHHRDHDRSNNSLSNLEPMTKKAHSKIHAAATKLDRDEAVRLYLSGLKMAEVAAVMGTHSGRVSRMLKERGVKARKR